MKSRIISAFATSAALSVAAFTADAWASADARYDLWTMTSDNEAVIAVTTHKDAKSYSVASGANEEALDVLHDKEAKSSLAALQKRADNHDLSRVLSHHSKEDKKRIRIIQKEVIEANEARGSGHNVIISENGDHEIDIEIDSHGEGEIKKVIELDGDKIDENALAEIAGLEKSNHGGDRKVVIQTNEDGVSTKLVRVSGVDADAARRFIDQIEGLTASERTAMKSELGL